jgi:predicted kinase
MDDKSYRVAYALAEDNLKAGLTVIADSVNPDAMTRDAWRAVARRANVRAIDIEIVCSDVEEHRRRVESRTSDIQGFTLPTSTRHARLWRGRLRRSETTRLHRLDEIAEHGTRRGPSAGHAVWPGCVRAVRPGPPCLRPH